MKTPLIILVSLLLFPFQVQSKNTILFLGDGMGITTVTAARIYEGQSKGLDGESNALSFESFEHVAFIKTYSADAQIPDSAGTMSAIMTGQKTRSGVISVGPRFGRGDCKSVIEDSHQTVMEIAEQAGLKTGIVTTARITDATPAATYAHSPDRTWENDQKITPLAKRKGCKDIADQLVSFSSGNGVDLILGGGRSNFHSKSTTDIEYPQLVGLRGDDRDLIDEWTNSEEGRRFIWNRAQLFANPMNGQVLGLFEPLELHYEVERPTDTADEPSLSEMAEYAVNFLSNNDKGFFLVIEGARIDHGNHNKEPYLALTDTVEFSNAVRKVLSLVDLNETTILVTADHSSALAFSGYPTRGMPVLGSLSYPEFSFSGGSRFQAGHLESKDEDRNRIAVSTEDDLAKHAGEDVPAYATGYKGDLIKGVMEQDQLFGVIIESLEL